MRKTLHLTVEWERERERSTESKTGADTGGGGSDVSSGFGQTRCFPHTHETTKILVYWTIMDETGYTLTPRLKGLSHEIFTVIFWLEWIYLGLNWNRFWFLNFKECPLILDSYLQYWCVPYQTFSEICRISEKDWQLSPQLSNFSFFWVSGPPRNVAKGINTFRRFVEPPRMIDN
jgi:hypothetical protein